MKKIIAALVALTMLLSCLGAFAESAEEVEATVYGPKIGVDFYSFNAEFRTMSEEYMAEGMSEQEAHAQTTRDLLTAIAEMGYEGVQYTPWFAWYDIDAAELKTLCEELGLEQLAPHYGVYLNWTEEEWPEQLAYLEACGINGITLDHNTPSQRVTGDPAIQITQDDLAAWAEQTIADIQYLFDNYEKYGYEDFVVGYHAHSWEFVRIREYGFRNLVEIIYDTFGDSVIMDLDTAWAATSHAGTTERLTHPWEDAALGEEGLVQYLWENGNMFPWIRLEDVNMETGYSAPIGQGDLEWDEIISAAVAHDCEWLIVQDHDEEQYNRNIFESLQCSIDYLNEMYKSLGLERQ